MATGGARIGFGGMPIYFLHTQKGDELLPDERGSEHPDLRSATLAANKKAAELATDGETTSNLEHFIVVEDEFRGKRLKVKVEARQTIGLSGGG